MPTIGIPSHSSLPATSTAIPVPTSAAGNVVESFTSAVIATEPSTPAAIATDPLTSAVVSSIPGRPSSTLTPLPSSSPSPTGSPSSPPSPPTSNTAPATYTVKVGSGGFKYEPAELKDVNVGDTVSFEFYPSNHSVARAEYGSPCVPYEYTGKGKVGFWSDTQVVGSVDQLTHYPLKINTTDPIFYYCAAPGSCTTHEMIGVINPNSTQTLSAQSALAGQSSFIVKPGDPVPDEAYSSLPNAPTSSSTSTSTTHDQTTLSPGIIAGIVVGAVAFLVLCAALFFYVGRVKSLERNATNTTNTNTQNQSHDPMGQYPGSPALSSPYSPSLRQAEYGGGQVVPGYYGGWSACGLVGATQIGDDVKHGYQYRSAPVELASPPLLQKQQQQQQQQQYGNATAELEASARK
ncbi:hypothetical protein P280DRAFT_518237 [Massarina eburnea CBS 473.64]|uniref:Extracellular serine-rich protein n=1 Tax=Massarina eburnea CBS 473.64 TaxID=1395130 RepID=A0A6A6S416_9PLEO|nr:hypothetical protein P280DRAFT_518237 [Massarina eburnea CBS 473.64]